MATTVLGGDETWLFIGAGLIAGALLAHAGRWLADRTSLYNPSRYWIVPVAVKGRTASV